MRSIAEVQLMDVIKNILINYWPQILAVILFIVSFILHLVKRKPINDVTSLIYDFACEGIKEAENLIVVYNDLEGHMNGKDKLAYVVSYVGSQLLKLFPNLNVGIYKQLIINIVEEILETPQKKGDVYGKKKTNG